MDVSLSELRELVTDREAVIHGVLWFMGSQRIGHDWATELELNWTDHSRIWKRLAYITMFLAIYLFLYVHYDRT